MNLITPENFKYTLDNKSIKLFTLKNKNGIVSQITNYGGRIVNLFTPDREGIFKDIVLGYSTAKEYLEKPDHFFGAIIGRYGNRIANSKFTIDDNEFLLDNNEGKHQLHGGQKGFHKVIWKANQISDSILELTHTSQHLNQGFPGTLEVKVIYALTDNNELEINYFATSDAKTVINLTNHSYFNLSGDFAKTIENHILQIKADCFLPVNSEMIPIGNLENVVNTPLDFREPKKIKQDIFQSDKQLELALGYDHNFVLNDTNFKFAAKVIDESSKRVMEVYTTEPGIQFYSGNHLDNLKGKQDIIYNKRAAFCLETQHFPNSPNQKKFPSTLLFPDQVYTSKTIYRFSVR